MHPNDLLRAGRGPGNVGHGKRRGIARNNRILVDGCFHLLKNLLLEVQVLEDRLDNQIGFFKTPVAFRAGNPAEGSISLKGPEDAPSYLFIQIPPDCLLSPPEGFLTDIFEEDIHSIGYTDV